MGSEDWNLFPVRHEGLRIIEFAGVVGKKFFFSCKISLNHAIITNYGVSWQTFFRRDECYLAEVDFQISPPYIGLVASAFLPGFCRKVDGEALISNWTSLSRWLCGQEGKTIHSLYVGETTHAIIVSTNVIHVSKRCCQSSDKTGLSLITPRRRPTTTKGKGFPQDR